MSPYPPIPFPDELFYFFKDFLNLFIYLFIYLRERERERERTRAQGGAEEEGPADSMLSVKPNAGLYPTTLSS